MTRTLSNAHRVEILANPGVPYQLPTALGDVIDLDANPSNVYIDVRPTATHSFTAFRNAFFGSFSGGIFNPYYGTKGAYIFCAGGGHSVQDFADAVILDMADGQWKLRGNANGHTLQSACTNAQLNGSPWAEYITSGSGVPAPTHQYCKPVIVPPSWGGGSHGSFLYLMGTTTQLGPNGGTLKTGAHKMNLAPGSSPGGLWSRASSNNISNTSFSNPTSWSDSCAVVDPGAGRAYIFFDNMQSSGPDSLFYLDLNDGLFKELAFGGTPYPTCRRPVAFVDPVRNLLIVKRNTDASDEQFMAWQLSNLAAGPTVFLNVSGLASLPGAATTQQWLWTHHTVEDAFYCYPGSGNLLYKLTPPASSPLTAQWTVTTRTLNSTPRTQSAVGSTHYTRFAYVPSINRFLWIADESNPAQLIY